jgi:hypothetical protein
MTDKEINGNGPDDPRGQLEELKESLQESGLEGPGTAAAPATEVRSMVSGPNDPRGQ